MTGVLLSPGEVVIEGMGPVHCSATRRDGRLCHALVGLPAAGSVLVLREEEAGRLRRAERGFYAFRCSRCGAIYTFAAPAGRGRAAA